MLFTTKPTALGKLAAVVVDESPWQSALEGVTGRGDRMPLDGLRGEDRQFKDERSPDWHVLQHHRARALAAWSSHPAGAVTRAALEAQGLTATDAAEARALELNRLVDPRIHPGMSRAQRDELFKTAADNKRSCRRHGSGKPLKPCWPRVGLPLPVGFIVPWLRRQTDLARSCGCAAASPFAKGGWPPRC